MRQGVDFVPADSAEAEPGRAEREARLSYRYWYFGSECR